ncbi:hypothetical protein SAMN05428978_10844 [Nitrosomonas sp. Nm34]|nr:hypothetical protein SAMN05428978_10844 [Nitrosomonas sp. Nm34]
MEWWGYSQEYDPVILDPKLIIRDLKQEENHG